MGKDAKRVYNKEERNKSSQGAEAWPVVSQVHQIGKIRCPIIESFNLC